MSTSTPRPAMQVQENCIDLVGRIADRGAEFVPAREWMRICFELLDMLKAHKKGIRRATVNTFGYIAKAIGPQDVLVTLLNNLKVQERQNRVCTTVAIAIVAETCSPFTVLPALMNEYKACSLLGHPLFADWSRPAAPCCEGLQSALQPVISSSLLSSFCYPQPWRLRAAMPHLHCH